LVDVWPRGDPFDYEGQLAYAERDARGPEAFVYSDATGSVRVDE